MKKKLSISLFILFFLIPAVNSFAEDDKASIVTFDVTINDTSINTINSQYPLIVYKDITYFPLTWGYCRWLGLDIDWDEEKGLKINKNNQFYSYETYEKIINNINKDHEITLPTYPIFINDVLIDNDTETWPFIVFRDITYFPLTWDLAVETFEWDYSWDEERGLIINKEGAIKDKEINLLSLINDLVYIRDYKFEAEIYEKKSKALISTTNGLKTSVINNEELNCELNFENLSIDYYGDRISVKSMGVSYIIPDYNINGYGIDYAGSKNSRFMGSFIMDAIEYGMMKTLFNCSFVGDDKEKIISIEEKDTTNNMEKWLIKYQQEDPYTKEINTIEALIGISNNKIEIISIEDAAYLYEIDILY
ncbi:hypothetical protein [Fusibacter ferrireducens]|uniref:Copper amine oxidase-like N-terminal domain-containing protein n=1 Tax=Fusibacter ferrireducens TaxID=2785058 RepID=A0ABR9ZMD0_9FIRM|nr:hypothetical protein [Fusibacter ferrireducens]MBF4691554.1 hypothetical protein [Fusibacter ferrireducens]